MYYNLNEPCNYLAFLWLYILRDYYTSNKNIHKITVIYYEWWL
jgi:hypothetical protein